MCYLGCEVLLEQVSQLIYFSFLFCILIITNGNYKIFKKKDSQMPLCHQRLEPESESIVCFFFFFPKNTQAKLSAAIYPLRCLEAVLHQSRVWLFFPAVWLIPSCFHSSVCFWGDKHWAVVLKGCNFLKYKINNWLWDKHFCQWHSAWDWSVIIQGSFILKKFLCCLALNINASKIVKVLNHLQKNENWKVARIQTFP